MRTNNNYSYLLLLFFTLTLFIMSCNENEVEINKAVNEIPIELAVGYLHDKRLPAITPELIEKSLLNAKAVIQKSFGLTNINFSSEKKYSIDEYFNSVLSNKKNTYNSLNPFNKSVNYTLTSMQYKFYRYFKLNNLLKFIPEKDLYKVNDIDSFHKYTLDTWHSKTKYFINSKYNGMPVFTEQSMFFQTCTQWKMLFKYQKDFDIIFHNTLIFYDDLDKPVPHTIYRHAKLGGMGNPSPNAPNFYKGLTIVSTIEYSGIEYFSKKELISVDELAKYFGYFIAHEFAHAALGLSDNYNHPLYCMMNSGPETYDLKDAVKYFEENNGACPLCKEQILKSKKRLISLYRKTQSNFKKISN